MCAHAHVPTHECVRICKHIATFLGRRLWKKRGQRSTSGAVPQEPLFILFLTRVLSVRLVDLPRLEGWASIGICLAPFSRAGITSTHQQAWLS